MEGPKEGAVQHRVQLQSTVEGRRQVTKEAVMCKAIKVIGKKKNPHQETQKLVKWKKLD